MLNVFEYDKRKETKFSDTAINLINRLNGLSSGFTIAEQLKDKIKEYLNLDVSASRCDYRLSRLQPK